MSLRSEVIRIFNELVIGGKKITALPSAGALSGTELLEIVQNGVSSKVTASALAGGSSNNYTGSSPTTITVGGLASGSNISTYTISQVLQAIVAPYINPAFSSFSISGQNTTVEVGTTLSGSKTFPWAITLNSGVVSTIDIYDNTAGATLLAGTPNDGSQAVTITTIQLNSNGSTQSWKGILHDIGTVQDINSSNFIVTSRFYIFYEAIASSVTNSASIRSLINSSFYTGSSSITLNTGSTLTKFTIALPPGVSVVSVTDSSALNANITSDYVLTGTINVLDAGGTNRAYNIYEMNIGAPYSSSHAHIITFS